MAHDVFVSHSSIDKAIADAACATLEADGIRCWIAPRDIRPGQTWSGAIVGAIAESKVMVLVFSSNANESSQVMREVERAVQKDVVIVPFRVEEVTPSADMEYFLSATHWLDAMTQPLEENLEKLRDTVRAILAEQGATPAPRAAGKPKPPPVVHPARAAKPARSAAPIALAALLLAALALGAAAFLFLGRGDGERAETPVAEAERESARESPPEDSERGAGGAETRTAESADVAVGTTRAGDVGLTAPTSAPINAEIEVGWTGPGHERDFVTIVPEDTKEGKYQKYFYTRESPGEIQVPDVPGRYEIRYLEHGSRDTLVARPLVVTDVETALEAAATAKIGGELEIAWQGPGHDRDFITVVPKETDEGKYTNYKYASEGSPVELLLPEEPGPYEIRYLSNQSRRTLASRPLTIESVPASLDAPERATIGERIEIAWTGPGNERDFVTIVRERTDEGKYGTYAYVEKGKPLRLVVPDEPGKYELRYLTRQQRLTLASRPIEVVDGPATLEAPDAVDAGGQLRVAWTGPSGSKDFITLVEAGTEEGKYGTYAYTENGSPARIRVPNQKKGAFELRYLTGQTRRTLASRPIEVR